MKTIKVFGNCCLVFLAVIGVCISLAFGYYHFFVNDITTGTNYIDNQLGVDSIEKVEDLTPEELDKFNERWFIEVNCFSNFKNNGIQLQELNFNYFADFTLTSDKYRSSGMQYIGDYVHHNVAVRSDSELDNYVFTDFYYYDTWDGISYNGYYGNNASTNCLLKRSTSFTIKIDNRAFEIQLDKFWTRKEGWWIFTKTVYHYYTWSELFNSIMNSVESSNFGYGDYYLELDLSDFFTIREYDLENGKLKTDDVTDIIKNYALVKVHYDENGANKSSQSLYGSIACNPSYGMQEEIDTTYWQERMLYTLNEDDISYRYSEVYDGYFISLNMSTKKLFEDMPRAKVNININLQSEYLQNKQINVVGIDYNGFENFEIDTLTIIGNPQRICLLDKALYNTQLKTLKYSKGITFDFANDAINNEYVEVVL